MDKEEEEGFGFWDKEGGEGFGIPKRFAFLRGHNKAEEEGFGIREVEKGLEYRNASPSFWGHGPVWDDP